MIPPILKLQPDLDHTSGIPDLTSMTPDYSPPIPDPTPLIHDATYLLVKPPYGDS